MPHVIAHPYHRRSRRLIDCCCVNTASVLLRRRVFVGVSGRPEEDRARSPTLVAMGQANAAAFPATEELLKARVARQSVITTVFVALVVLTLAGSKLADVTGFVSTRPTRHYAAVIDAGSTGTRLHVFTFSRGRFGGDETLRGEAFHAVEPGLKSYGADAAAAAASVDQLLAKARAVVPARERASTPLSVRATAGLRLMPEGREAADAIMKAVRDKIAASGFHAKSSESFVGIMDGADEGAHGWVSVNYLLGNFGGSPEKTVSVVDLGGGSTQIAYAVGSRAAKEAPDGYVREIQATSSKYSTYVRSFKGYGLVAVRAKIFNNGKNDDGSHPCLPAGFADSCEKNCYGLEPGETYAALGSGDGSDFDKCLAATMGALDVGSSSKSCTAKPCSFAGAWSTPRKTALYVMSYIVERAIQSGAVPPPKDATKILKISPADFKRAASRACATPAAELEDAFPLAARDGVDVHYLCLDLTYIYALLTAGYGAADDETVRMLDKIMYKRQAVEASWALGDGIAVLGAVRSASYRD